MSIEAAAEIAEGLKSEKSFDARRAVTGATYPQDKIDVYSDAKLAHELNIAVHDAAQARFLADSIKERFAKQKREEAAADQGVEAEPYDGDGTEAPDYAEANAAAEELEAKVPGLLEALQGTVLTFHLRGLAPAQWRLIHKKWRKEIKPPARKNWPSEDDANPPPNIAASGSRCW